MPNPIRFTSARARQARRRIERRDEGWSAGAGRSNERVREKIKMSDKKRAAYRTGIVVFLIVAVLTAVEFYLASISGAIAVLFFIALIKAALIVRYFMHVNRLWTDEGHE